MVDFKLTEEQIQYQNLAREFARDEIAGKAHEYDKSGEYPTDVLAKAFEVGLLHSQIPDACGGLSLSTFDTCLMAEELAWGCSGISGAIEGSTMAELAVILSGSREQQKNILAPMLEDFALAGFALNAEELLLAAAGAKSNLALNVVAKREGDSYVLTSKNGKPTKIVNAEKAAWYTVFAQTDESVSCFLVPKSASVSVGERQFMLGRKALDIRSVVFASAKVEASHLIGEAGKGMDVVAKLYSHALAIEASGCIGLSRSAMEHAIRYSKERHTFGKPIANHQAVAFMIADMAKDIEAARLMTWQAAYLCDKDAHDLATSIKAKAFAQDAAMRVATDAVQVFGGYGYSREYPVEKLMRDAKAYQVEDGLAHTLKTILGKQLKAALV